MPNERLPPRAIIRHTQTGDLSIAPTSARIWGILILAPISAGVVVPLSTLSQMADTEIQEGPLQQSATL